ncbi:MAG: fasciclin domain-containing protein [Kastovskya adunca ATA6-11-RM4]|jgi:uncharacterized surface protein with fasciclin (FAS1) repeats|nr:fasciclin domain-containing protein [Kastovskya adunca ATA6-11-RM4]
MKTRIQLLTAIFGLSALISAPAFAQANQLEDAFTGIPGAREESTSESLNPPAKKKQTLQETPTETIPESADETEIPVDDAPQVPVDAVPVSPTDETLDSSVDAEPAGNNLVEQAADSEQFQTLAKAIEAAGLEETLSTEGPYTLFAPTDEAFAALPEGILEQLLQPENKEILVQLLSYHVVPGAITSSQIESGEAETLTEGTLEITKNSDGTVSVNNATVTQADIQVSNGVIHAVDQVILPLQAQTQLKVEPEVASNN